MRFTILPTTHPLRDTVESFAREVYARSHGARIGTFPPMMAALIDDRGQPVAAAGLRTAQTGFFSEIYLDLPVEQAIAAELRMPVARDGVLEVTTLVGLGDGAAFRLLDGIVVWGRRNELRWGLFTATTRLRRRLRRGRLSLAELAPARSQRLADASTWGRYYETDPWVCAVGDSKALPIAFDRVRPAPANQAVAKEAESVHA